MEKELFYLLSCDSEFAEIQPTSRDEQVFEQFESLKNNAKVGSKWVAAELQLTSGLKNGQQMPDFLFWLGHTPLVKSSIKSIIEAIFPESDIEYLPMKVCGTSYQAMNVLHKESGLLNRKQSEVEYFKDRDVKFVNKYVFNNITQAPSMFRIEESTTSLFITTDSNKALLKHNFTGIETKEVPTAEKCKRTLFFFLIPLILLLALFLIYFSGIFSQQQPQIAELGEVEERALPHIESNLEIPTYVISDMTPVAGAVTNINYVENIEDFIREVTDNFKTDSATTTGRVVIPAMSLFFGFNSSAIYDKSNQFIDTYAQTFLRTNQNAKICIEGFACSIGSNEANDKISRSRAENVKNELVAKGVDPNTITIKWYGSSKNNSLNYKSNNDYRRVNIVIL